MPTKNEIIKLYSDIPKCPDYVISSKGDIIKKATWKPISVRNGIATITVKGKRKVLTINKLLRELFAACSLPPT